MDNVARPWHWMRSIGRDYFGVVTAPTIHDVEGHLWTDDVDPATLADNEPYYRAVLDQYKTYVEMADRISARRGLTNTFFLTLNTAIISAAGVLWKDHSGGSRWLLLFPLLGVLVECLAWYWLLRSYQQLNAAKYVVIGAIEQQLPASPYWRAEWAALGLGESPARYMPMAHIEQLVPILFAAVYIVGFIAVLAA